MIFNTGKLMVCADGEMWQWYPVIWAWTADYFENIHLHWIKQHHCPVCKALKSSFGEGNQLLWQLRDYLLCLRKLTIVTRGDEMDRQEEWHYLQDRVVGTLGGASWNMKCISPTSIIIPGILHKVYFCILEHWMAWVTTFLEQHSSIDKFNEPWVMMPPYTGFARFYKP